MRDICVIGLGLLGGSVLRSAVAAGRTAWGATESGSDAEAATVDGYDAGTDVDAALRRAAERDAVVVSAVPLPAVDEVLRRVAAHAPACVLTDVTSVKGPVLGSVRRLVPQARYAGGHPMTGTAESGWAAGNVALFDGAAWVVCVEDDTDLAVWSEVAALALDAGARVVPLSASAHDEAVARVSHLPHLLAAVLATVGGHGGPLAASLSAGSFGDGTRVAGSRPELVRAMTEGNREALLPVLDEALGMLGATRGSLASTGGLASTINAGYQGMRTLAEHRDAARTEVLVRLDAPDARDGLRALGERGGHITAVADGSVTGQVA
ncbi:prephenate dehydrogenase [Amycolatopsis antarctica]|uniref:Prephenate dehydrogenase n=1 Tax=Amycolatopsis antarctica TaxID=1854586 RepID=A0A263D544_9PSEU|nr:prephenate dehydrogenase [Amycolatopsis antarctica]OZM73319.1 prephenate dehydrogenase [Amycolatopsis antarctica]